MKKNLVTAAATAGFVLTAFGVTANAQEITYTVHPGDSLSKISHINNVSVNQLKEWNHLSSDRIYVNQKLSLSYTVQVGDTLSKLAKTYGTTVSEIKKANGLTSDLIRIGQPLTIPNSKSGTPAAPINTTYLIQKGDSLSVIGERFNVSVSQLKSMNHLTSDTIIAGKALNVSGAESAVSSGSTATSEKAAASSDAKASVQTAAPANSSTTRQPAANSKATNVETPAAASNSSVSGNSAVKQDATETNTPAANSNAPTAVKPAAPSNSAAVAKPAAPSNSVAVAKPAALSNSAAAATPAAPAHSTAVTKPAANSGSNVAQKAAVTSASTVQSIISEAEKYIGTPYRWGGNTPAGWDCSGFTKYVFNQVGISLPRTAETQWAATTPVSSPRIGDLVFFETYKPGPSHVGIYLGNNKFISSAAQGVVISDMTATYWKTRYLGARSPY